MTVSDAPRLDPRVARSRAAVLDAAQDLLLRDGLDAVTVDAVLARSGVARSTLYRHWPGRAELLTDVFAGLMPRPEPPPPPGPFRDRLSAVVRHAAREMRRHGSAPLVANLLHAAHFDPELAGFCDRFSAEKRAPLLSVLRDAESSGELREDVVPDDVVGLVVGPIYHRAVVMRHEVDEAWIAGHVDRVHRAVARAA